MGTRTYLFYLPEFSARSPPRNHKTPNNPPRSRPPLWRFGVAWPLVVETHGSLCASFALPTLSQTWLLTPEGRRRRSFFFTACSLIRLALLSREGFARAFFLSCPVLWNDDDGTWQASGRADFFLWSHCYKGFYIVRNAGDGSGEADGTIVRISFLLLCEVRIGHFPLLWNWPKVVPESSGPKAPPGSCSCSCWNTV